MVPPQRQETPQARLELRHATGTRALQTAAPRAGEKHGAQREEERGAEQKSDQESQSVSGRGVRRDAVSRSQAVHGGGTED